MARTVGTALLIFASVIVLSVIGGVISRAHFFAECTRDGGTVTERTALGIPVESVCRY